MKKNGFTLIELLAVIIILGILMIIAIPSVTKYISDSRKNAYIDTAKEIIGGARNIVNDGKLEMYATDTTYYIPTACIKTENASKSPYGEFTKAYIGVIYDGKGYKYYWISVDDAGQGVSKITPLDKLDTDDIESDLKDSDIESVVTTTGIGNRSEIKILNCSNNNWDGQYHLDDTSGNASEDGLNTGGNGSNGSSNGENDENYLCKPATTLHNENCERIDGNKIGCRLNDLYLLHESITYGSIYNGSSLIPGNAFDCDVNDDGIFNAENERFYYVTTNNSTAILIYYKNTSSRANAYDSSGENWHGPRTSYAYLPNISEWKNSYLSQIPTRQISNEISSTSYTTGSGIHNIETFTYDNKITRFLTYQEFISACSPNELQSRKCNYFVENTTFTEDNFGAGYWLETPKSSDSKDVLTINGTWLEIGLPDANLAGLVGTRPVIEVNLSYIDY